MAEPKNNIETDNVLNEIAHESDNPQDSCQNPKEVALPETGTKFITSSADLESQRITVVKSKKRWYCEHSIHLSQKWRQLNKNNESVDCTGDQQDTVQGMYAGNHYEEKKEKDLEIIKEIKEEQWEFSNSGSSEWDAGKDKDIEKSDSKENNDNYIEEKWHGRSSGIIYVDNGTRAQPLGTKTRNDYVLISKIWDDNPTLQYNWQQLVNKFNEQRHLFKEDNIKELDKDEYRKMMSKILKHK